MYVVHTYIYIIFTYKIYFIVGYSSNIPYKINESTCFIFYLYKSVDIKRGKLGFRDIYIMIFVFMIFIEIHKYFIYI